MSPRTPQTWPENVEPTVQELADWLAACTDDERLDFVQRAMSAWRHQSECFMQDHHGAMRELERRRDEYRAGFLEACEQISNGLAGLP